MIKVQGWFPDVRPCYRGASNMSEAYFSTYTRAQEYIESRKMYVRKITEVSLPRDDPRVDYWYNLDKVR